MAALIHRNRTGEGQHIEVAQIEALINCIGEAVLDYQVSGKIPGPEGNRHGMMSPHNNYRCQGDDKWVSIAVKTDEDWKNFLAVMGNPPALCDDKFSTIAGRHRYQEELDDNIAEWTKNHTADEIAKMLQAVGVAAFPCMDIGNCFLNPHFQEREVFTSVDHPVTGSEFIAGPSWKMSETNGGIYRHAPLLGQHNSYVFGEILGLTEEEIASLEEKEIIQK